MGSLKPGASYIYERVNGVTYAREVGAKPETRVPIGWDANNENVYEEIANHYYNDKLWSRIFEEARTNTTLQQALERVIILYKLSVSKYD